MSHQSRAGWLGIKTRHTKARFLRRLPRVWQVAMGNDEESEYKSFTDSEIHNKMVLGTQAPGAEEG